MKLVPSRPVTIDAVRHAQRWFPALYRHIDGSLLMYTEFGYDSDFSPLGRWSSRDGGRTWLEEEENVPRGQIVHSFADGTLLEMDAYGFLDPKKPSTYCYYGAWSTPGCFSGPAGHSAFYHGEKDLGEDWLHSGDARDANPLRRIFRLESPSMQTYPISKITHGYPHHPWWPLINSLHGADVAGEDVLMGGPNITDTVEAGGRLLAVGYGLTETGSALSSVFCYESRDRGFNWREISCVARGSAATTEGFNETSLVALKDGRLYCVIRSGDLLYHTWSQDSGQSWAEPTPMTLIDSSHAPRMVWPRCATLEDGTLVLAYGRPGKHLIFDPSCTGDNWQGHLDLHAWELETQEMMGVPSNQRLRGATEVCTRYWDSGDYLSVVPIGPREMLVTYDVQNYVENWNAVPVSGVRMVRVMLED